jgi:4-amino-4-deoxy-L-arabinose transferase-like glycosyltransferase
LRFPSALLSALSALTVFAVGLSVLGMTAALVSSLVLLTSFEWLRAATSARVDMTLAFGLTLAFAALLWLRRSPSAAARAFLYFGMTCAVLSKGPIGIALPLLQIAVLCLVDRSLAFARRLHLIRGLVIVVIFGGAWYALALWQGGGEFFRKQILDENVLRFLGTEQFTGGHRHSVWYLAGTLLAGLLPWTVFMPAVALLLWRNRARLRASDPLLFSLLWILIVFAFHAVPASKRGVYLLPLYPAACLLMGWWWSEAMSRKLEHRWLSAACTVAALPLGFAFLILLLGSIAELAGIPVFAAAVSAVGPAASTADRRLFQLLASRAGALTPFFIVASLSAFAAAVAARRSRWATLFAALVLTITTVTMSVQHAILPSVAAIKTRKPFADAVHRVARPARRLFTFRGFDYGVLYYWGGRIPVYRQPPSKGGPRYLIMGEHDWLALDRTREIPYERVPLIEAGRGGNLGRLVLVQNTALSPQASTDTTQ